MSIVSSGILATDLATIGIDAETTLYIDGMATVASNLTVPNNVHIVVRDAGRLKLEANCSLIIQGTFVCERRQVFEYDPAETCSVQFDARTPLYPEWWYAEGDGTDYLPAIRRMFRVPSPLETQHHVVFTSGKVYPLDCSSGGINLWGEANHSSWVIEGYGAELKPINTMAKGTAVVTIGTVSPDKRVHNLVWRGLSISQQWNPTPGTAAIRIANSSFGTIRDCNLNGTYYGIEAADWGGNMWTMQNVNINCPIGASLGPNLSDAIASFNGWRFVGGKIQQGLIGIHGSGVQIEIEAIDFSLHTKSAIFLENADEVRLKFYTERIGPELDKNLGKVLHLKNVKLAQIAGCFINGTTSKSPNYNTNCGYGAYLEGCTNVHFTGNLFKYNQQADVYIDERSTGIIIEEDNIHEYAGNAMKDVLKVIDLGVGNTNRVKTRALPGSRTFDVDYVGEAVNLIPSSCDFTDPSWEKLDDATVVTNPTILAPDGISQAQIVRFPFAPMAPPPPAISKYSSLSIKDLDVGMPLNGKTVVLRYWFKPIAVATKARYQSHPPDSPFDTDVDLHFFQSRLQYRTTDDISYWDTDAAIQTASPATARGDWQFIEHTYAIPNAPNNNLKTLALVWFGSSEYGGDAIEVALWGVQLFVTDTLTKHMPYLPKPARLGVLNLPAYGRLTQGPRVLTYGHKLVREVVAETSPQVLSLPLPPGGTSWRVGDICWNSKPTKSGVAGWICVVEGTPGIWKPYGTIDPVGDASYLKVTPDATPGTPTPETPFFWVEKSITIRSIFYLPNANVVPNAGNGAALVVRRRGSNGEGAVLAKVGIDQVGGGMSAFVAKRLEVGNDNILRAGQALTFEITKNAGGVLIPAGALVVTYSVI